MQGEVNRLHGMARTIGEFTEVIAHRQLQLHLQGVNLNQIERITAKAMKKLHAEMKSRWKASPKEVTTRTATKLRRQWLNGTPLLDVRNACRDFPGPQERPTCEPGHDIPLANVDAQQCHRTVKHWEVAAPHALCESSWEEALVCFDRTGRACMKYPNGAVLNPPGGYVHNKDWYLHSPVTGHVMFLRRRGSKNSGHKLFHSGPMKEPQQRP